MRETRDLHAGNFAQHHKIIADPRHIARHLNLNIVPAQQFPRVKILWKLTKALDELWQQIFPTCVTARADFWS